MNEDFRERVDSSRVGALGHSSGGATVMALGGATLDPAALSAYCRSDAGLVDRGCQYARQSEASPPAPAEATRSYRDSRVNAIVALDPAAGPGHDATSLAQVHVPVLVVGSEDNDFLPFEHHAGRYAALLPNAVLVKLQDGEGHFVYLNSCTSDLAANGVPLCVDRRGVDREAVHAKLAPQIRAFFSAAMPGERQQRDPHEHV
jgi:predicted dienelactone hydrolase